MADSLTGDFFVRAFRPAFDDVHDLFSRTRDKAEVRRHALKLRYWPDSITTEPSGPSRRPGLVLDSIASKSEDRRVTSSRLHRWPGQSEDHFLRGTAR